MREFEHEYVVEVITDGSDEPGIYLHPVYYGQHSIEFLAEGGWEFFADLSDDESWQEVLQDAGFTLLSAQDGIWHDQSGAWA